MQGEITLVIEGAAKTVDRVSSKEDLTAALRAVMAEGYSPSTAVRVVKEQTGAAKRDLYEIAVQLAAGDSAVASGLESNDSQPESSDNGPSVCRQDTEGATC